MPLFSFFLSLVAFDTTNPLPPILYVSPKCPNTNSKQNTTWITVPMSTWHPITVLTRSRFGPSPRKAAPALRPKTPLRKQSARRSRRNACGTRAGKGQWSRDWSYLGEWPVAWERVWGSARKRRDKGREGGSMRRWDSGNERG